MIIIPNRMSKLEILKQSDIVVSNVRFIEYYQIELVLKACNYNVSKLKFWFDIVRIKYDDINIVHNIIIYTINNETLSLSDLSHGERTLLYLIACKELNLSVTIHSLLERLCGSFRKILYDNFKDYKKLVIVLYNAIVPDYMEECMCENEDTLKEVIK